MAKVNQTNDNYMNQLRQQVAFLIKSSIEFDNGDITEGKRLALILRILLHDTNTSKSIFKLLNIKNMKFCNSANAFDPENLIAHFGLLNYGTNINGMLFGVPLNTRKITLVIFDKWWNELVIKDTKSNEQTRKKLVLNITNTDGGAHVDDKLKKEYFEISREKTNGWVFTNNKGTKKIDDKVELLSVRQIGHEVLLTLEKNLFSDKNIIDLIKKYNNHLVNLKNIEEGFRYFQLGMESVDKGNSTEAIGYFDLAYEKNPKCIVALVNKANSLGSLNKLSDALDTIEKVLILDPNNIYALKTKLTIYQQQQASKEVFDLSCKILELEEENFRCWTNKGIYYFNNKEYENSLRMLNNALEYNNKYFPALLVKAKLLRMLNKYNEAYRMICLAEEVDLGNVDVLTEKE